MKQVKLTAKWTSQCANGVSSETTTLATNSSRDFDYTGAEKCVILTNSGYYKLEVWGAQGGGNSSNSYRPGYGAYGVGVINTELNNTLLYITIGGQGQTDIVNGGGGYNGGGAIRSSEKGAGGGGGATHVATISGLLKDLSSYKDTAGANISKEILIVAGGGGGNWTYGGLIGGDGGGFSGKKSSGNSNSGGNGGTQTAGGTSYWRSANNGSFGQGGSVSIGIEGGGGAGWYGGSAGGNGSSSNLSGGGGGGSGYIGSSNLISGGGITKHMTCYSCATSTAAATHTKSNTNVSSTATADYSKIGNGYARITYLGTSLD